MAKKKWLVEFMLNLSDCRVIAADTAEEAKEIALEMLYDGEKGDSYWDSIIEGMENDTENWRKKYCEIEAFDTVPAEYEADNEEE